MKRLLIAAVAAVALASAGLLLPIERWAVFMVAWFRGAGAVGIAAYGLVYVAAVLLLVPASPLIGGAGFLYGPLWGALLASAASVVAATLAFALGRSGLRGPLEDRLPAHRRFSAIHRAVGDEGFKIVLLLRLSLIVPFGLMSYALGLTRVRPASYVAASLLGMLPGIALFAYLGSLVTSAAQFTNGAAGSAGGPRQHPLYWLGLAVTAVVTVLLTVIARRAVRRTLADGL